MIVSLGIVEQAVHTGVQADDLALQIGLVDAPLLAGGIQMLVGDQSPWLNVDRQNDGFACVGIDRHLMGITGSSSVELVLHDVTRGVAVRTGMHGAHDALGQNAALGHGVCVIDHGFVKIRPARDLGAERMGKVYEYFCHVFLLISVWGSRSPGRTHRPRPLSISG